MFKSKDLVLVILMLIFVSTSAQSIKTERKSNIDFDWKFKLGDYPNASQLSFDDSDWRSLDLPHDWSIEGSFDAKLPMGNDGGYLPAGIGWYRKVLNLSSDQKNKNLTLYFEGIYMNAEVFINGISLGIRPYGFSSFFYDISLYAKEGKNVIAVKVDNSQQKNCRWYTGSGIYRHVWLISVNPVHAVQWETFVTTIEAGSKEAKVNVKLNVKNSTNSRQQVVVEINIFDNKNKKTAKSETLLDIPADSNKDVVQDITIKKPNLWSVLTPDLYRAEINISQKDNLMDRSQTSFGIRKIVYNANDGFLVNGVPVKLNGGCVHHDNGALGAVAYDAAEIKKAELLKKAGFNALRTSHNPPSEAFLNACDSIGIMVIDESFDGWREEKNTYDYSIHFDKWWKKDIEALVLRDRNHPSVIMWSIGNEIIERKTLEAVQTAHKLANHVRKLDPSRPVTSAMTTWDNDWEIFDPLFAMHDIGGYNYQMHRAESDHERVPSRIILQTESYPRDAFKNWKAVKDHSYIIGDFVWTAMDYLGESGIGRYYYTGDVKGEHYERDIFPWHGAYCGDVDLIGHRKPISYYREMLYSEKKMLYMAVKEPNNYYGEIQETLWSVWPTWESWNWPGYEGKLIDVEIYSTYPSVRLYQDGKLVGEKQTTRNEEFKAVFQIPYNSGEIKAVSMLNGREVQSQILQTAEKAALIALKPDKTVLKADGQDLSYINIDITDLKGVRDPNADNILTFEIEGAGTIVSVANANLKDTDSYVSKNRKAWKGQAQVVIKSKKEKGNIILKVKSSDLQDASLKLSVQ
ncbi:beta-galactosidase [Flavobacterium sp. 90]|uniref:glycoside hydrolase family 2 TIM barrel-domain containing protein n=1 Tax=unclassified Flavobacterium TaxID=196869 RepID=UPI000EB1AFEB|nr:MULTISPECIES: glycoside hydrolase family 2 TIM barrel-domain containing protein [unclassified Flavobacterium]RKR04595.1 beta-galactosidase [Flavobacterium sp. 81]TCK55922.1 beta-galactosidase [Flavobacterium sp. 90]